MNRNRAVVILFVLLEGAGAFLMFFVTFAIAGSVTGYFDFRAVVQVTEPAIPVPTVTYPLWLWFLLWEAFWFGLRAVHMRGAKRAVTTAKEVVPDAGA